MTATRTSSGAGARSRPNGSTQAAAIVLPGESSQIVLQLVGLTPLLSHAWSEQAKEEIRLKQQKGARLQRAAKDPEAQFRGTLYVLGKSPESYGFPAAAFRNAAIDAANRVDLKKTHVRAAFAILNAVDTDQGMLIPLKYGQLRRREDVVRIRGAMSSSIDLRYRAEFRDWSAELHIQYNPRVISTEELVALFADAGSSVGIGDWRPQCNGHYGRFRVDAVRELRPTATTRNRRDSK